MDPSRARHAALLLLAVAWLPALASASTASARAGPTVGELLAVCERGRTAGGVGVDAAMCEWYAVPCDCAGKAPEEGPRWCMPTDESVTAALAKVVAALRRAPDPQAAVAEVVPTVMARLYPCAGAP